MHIIWHIMPVPPLGLANGPRAWPAAYYTNDLICAYIASTTEYSVARGLGQETHAALTLMVADYSAGTHLVWRQAPERYATFAEARRGLAARPEYMCK